MITEANNNGNINRIYVLAHAHVCVVGQQPFI